MLNYRNFEQQIKDFDTEKEQFNLRIIELTEQTYEYESQIAKLKEELGNFKCFIFKISKVKASVNLNALNNYVYTFIAYRSYFTEFNNFVFRLAIPVHLKAEYEKSIAAVWVLFFIFIAHTRARKDIEKAQNEVHS